MAGVVRADTPTSLVGADGRRTVLLVDANGRLHVLDANSAAAAASLSVMDDWDESDRGKVNIIVGQAGVAAGAGAVGATTQRTTLASDDPAVATLGSTTGAKVVTDATGTIQQYLRGLVHLWTTGLAAGTAFLGKLLPPDIDVTTHSNYARKYYTNAGAVTDGIVWSPAAGKRWHVVSAFIQVSADCTLTLEDDKGAGDAAVLKGEFKAGSGLTINFGEKYPLASEEDAADLLVTTTAGNVYITLTGYEV